MFLNHSYNNDNDNDNTSPTVYCIERFINVLHTDYHTERKENIYCLFLTYSKLKLTGTNSFFIYY